MDKLKDFKVTQDIPVRWGDMDAYEHVNNAVYIKWNEHIRIAYLEKVFPDWNDQNIGPILARQECTYIYPMSYPDVALCGCRVIEILEDRIIFETRIYSQKHQRISALLTATIMAYNHVERKKAKIPLEWKNKIANLDNVEI